jgi:hypothetical protein
MWPAWILPVALNGPCFNWVWDTWAKVFQGCPMLQVGATEEGRRFNIKSELKSPYTGDLVKKTRGVSSTRFWAQLSYKTTVRRNYHSVLMVPVVAFPHSVNPCAMTMPTDCTRRHNTERNNLNKFLLHFIILLTPRGPPLFCTLAPHFFYSKRGGGGVESDWVHSALRPPICLLCQPRVTWWWRTLWNDNWQGKPKYSEKTCHQRHFVRHKSHMTRPRFEPGPPRWVKPATNRLSYGTAKMEAQHITYVPIRGC